MPNANDMPESHFHKMNEIVRAITFDRLMELASDENLFGFCLGCGAQATNVDLDAFGEQCMKCNARAMYSCEEMVALLCPPMRYRDPERN